MSAGKHAQYDHLKALPTPLKNGTELQYVPSEYQFLDHHMLDRPAFRVHCQRLLYFVLFYALLAAFFFNYMSWLMYFQVSRDYPRLTGTHSALSMNPGLSFVPQPNIFSSLIHMQTSVPLSVSSLSDYITAFLHSYQDNTGCTEREDCVKEGGLNQDPERPCAYDVSAGGPCNMISGFGYDAAQPCFALKMGKIYGWLPDPVDGADGVLVRCEGYNEDDTNHLGVIRYFDMDYKFSAVPPGINPGKLGNGTFRSMYFPYRNQACYHQPLVFVQFDGVTKHTLIRVRCYLIAKNIHVDFGRGEGSVSFEILAD